MKNQNSDHMIDAARFVPTNPKKKRVMGKIKGWARVVLFYIIGIIDRAVLVPFPFLKSPSMSEIALKNKYWFNTILRLILAFVSFFCWLLI